jgi:cytochrome c oxidase subunit IV
MSANHIVPVRTYLAVIAALMALTALTVWASFQDFGGLNGPVALGIAAVKTMLVVSIFMHLKYSARIVWMFAGAGVVFLLILIAFVVGDIKGREWQYRARGWDAAPPPVAAAVSHP